VGLRRRLGNIQGVALGRSAARTLGASILGAVAGWGAARVLAPPGGAGALMRIVPGAAGLGAFALVYGLAAWGMRAPELEEITGALRRRLAGRRGIEGRARA
jgi:uncharacterized membrane protein YeaQ/YmgE (transglycosylase-associated protein family)